MKRCRYASCHSPPRFFSFVRTLELFGPANVLELRARKLVLPLRPPHRCPEKGTVPFHLSVPFLKKPQELAATL
jgi:hypothetical protein